MHFTKLQIYNVYLYNTLFVLYQTLPDTVQICGRISPDQMWDYLGKIRQAGSRVSCLCIKNIFAVISSVATVSPWLYDVTGFLWSLYDSHP